MVEEKHMDQKVKEKLNQVNILGQKSNSTKPTETEGLRIATKQMLVIT